LFLFLPLFLSLPLPAFRIYPRLMRSEEHEYFVYILASRSRNLYIGVTNHLLRRIAQHRKSKTSSFSSRYRTHRLVYFERLKYINNAIAREKHLKHFTREEKIALIESTNPAWEDLAAEYLPPYPAISL
jgi:putative endonuclease